MWLGSLLPVATFMLSIPADPGARENAFYLFPPRLFKLEYCLLFCVYFWLT